MARPGVEDDDFVVDEAPPPGRQGPGGTRRVAPLVAGVVVLVVAVPLAVSRWWSPIPSGADLDGVGPVRLGDSREQFEAAVCDGSGSCGRPGELVPVLSDAERGCGQYETVTPDGAVLWAWIRRGEVVAAGREAPLDGSYTAPPAGEAPVPTGVGPRFGDPLDDTERPRGWRPVPLPAGAPVTAASREAAGRLLTVADTDGDGLVDSHSTATTEGEPCRGQPYPPVRVAPPRQSVPLVDGTVAGLRIGQRIDRWALPEGLVGVIRLDSDNRDLSPRCVWLRTEGRDALLPAVAFAHDDVVVGVQSTAVAGAGGTAATGSVAGGPAQRLADAMTALGGPDYRLRREPYPGTIVAEVRAGPPVRVHAARAVLGVAGYDRPVAVGEVDDALVTRVLVGDSCRLPR